MKTISQLLLLTCLSAGTSKLAAEPAPGVPTNESPGVPASAIQAASERTPPAPALAPESVTNAAATAAAPATAANLATNVFASTNAVAATNIVPPPVVVENDTNGLRLN